jgi:hypothetical protein
MIPLNVQRRRGSVIWYDSDGKYNRMTEEEFNAKFNSSPELELEDDEKESVY